MPAEPKPAVAEQIVALKRSRNPHCEAITRAFSEVDDYVRRGADAIRDNIAAGRAVMPEIDFRDIQHGSYSEAARQAVRETGCDVARGVFEESIARELFAELSEYIEATRGAAHSGRLLHLPGTLRQPC
jgi:hypothetical protein